MNTAAQTIAAIAALGRLDLVARQIVEGFLVGQHRSPYHGFSSEFLEYREYEPGESVEHVDWQLYQQTGDLFVKVFAEETNLRATLLVDCSASMGYASEPGGTTKLDYARLLAASFAYLLLRQKDAVGLEVFDERPRASVRSLAIRSHFNQLAGRLNELPPGEGTALGPMLDATARRLRRRGLVLLFSDLMDDPEAVIDGLKHLRYREHEVIVFQILDPREIDFGFRREALFSDLERPGEEILLDPALARSVYRERIAVWRDRLRDACRRHAVELVELTTETPFERALLEYLSRRRRVS